MSSQETREARRKRQSRGARDSIEYRNRSKSSNGHPGPLNAARQKERWSDDFIGEDPHDDEYFQDRELDFNE